MSGDNSIPIAGLFREQAGIGNPNVGLSQVTPTPPPAPVPHPSQPLAPGSARSRCRRSERDTRGGKELGGSREPGCAWLLDGS